MKYRKLFLILTIATLSLTACSKELTEVPAVEETVESVIEETEISSLPLATETATSDEKISFPSILAYVPSANIKLSLL